jgi:FKBP-type peptidyl-prolyl cis-trans isomerase (trigger factor)
VTVKAVRSRIVPALDDEFAKMSAIASLDARARVREDLSTRRGAKRSARCARR